MSTWGKNDGDGKLHCEGLDAIKADNVVSVLLLVRDWKESTLCEEYPSRPPPKKPELRDYELTASTTSYIREIEAFLWKPKGCKRNLCKKTE